MSRPRARAASSASRRGDTTGSTCGCARSAGTSAAATTRRASTRPHTSRRSRIRSSGPSSPARTGLLLSRRPHVRARWSAGRPVASVDSREQRMAKIDDLTDEHAAAFGHTFLRWLTDEDPVRVARFFPDLDPHATDDFALRSRASGARGRRRGAFPRGTAGPALGGWPLSERTQAAITILATSGSPRRSRRGTRHRCGPRCGKPAM